MDAVYDKLSTMDEDALVAHLLLGTVREFIAANKVTHVGAAWAVMQDDPDEAGGLLADLCNIAGFHKDP